MFVAIQIFVMFKPKYIENVPQLYANSVIVCKVHVAYSFCDTCIQRMVEIILGRKCL